MFKAALSVAVLLAVIDVVKDVIIIVYLGRKLWKSPPKDGLDLEV